MAFRPAGSGACAGSRFSITGKDSIARHRRFSEVPVLGLHPAAVGKISSLFKSMEYLVLISS